MIHAPRRWSGTDARAARALVVGLGVLTIGACRARQPVAPREPPSHDAGAEGASRDRDDDLASDLGPADPILAPLHAPAPEPYILPALPKRLRIGRPASGARRPTPGNEPLLVAVDRPAQVIARDESYVHVAAWRQDGRPAAGARVFVGDREIGRADRQGALVAALPVASESDRLWVIDGPRCGAVRLAPVHHLEGTATDHLFVHADRGVFRPGDTLHLRGLGLRRAGDDRPLVGAEIEVQLRDHEGHTVAASTALTDDLGVLATDLPIATTARDGLHTLSVAYGAERAETRVQVREFSATQVRIDHTLPFFLPRDAKRLAFDLRLSDPAGEPLRGANVEVVLSVAGKRRLELKKRVEGGGPHSFEIGRHDLDRVRRGTRSGDVVVVTVRASDDEGRREEVRRDLRVTAHRFVAGLDVDRDHYATGAPVLATVRLADLDRVPQRQAPVELRLRYAGTRVTLQAETDGGGLARFQFDMPASDVEARLFVDGVNPAIAATTVRWGPERAMAAELADDSITAGAPVAVTVHFPGGWVPAGDVVHADVVDASGAIVDATLLDVKEARGRWVARGRVTPPTWGTAQLSIFALGRRSGGAAEPPAEPASALGLLTAGESLIVSAGRELEVVLEDVPGKIRPGSPIDVRAKIRDRRGRPVRAAVGAALVDSAVLSLKDPLERTPIDALHDPRLRTRAVGGAELPPWPVLVRNWGKERVDVSRPPFAALEGGAIERCDAPSDGESPPGRARERDSTGSLATVSAARPRPARDPAATRPIQTEITLRTRVPTTTMWAPSLRGEGEVRIDGRLSGTLGEQELVVVASDGTGGLGLARAKIRAAQPVSVRADLPRALVAGERVEIPVVVHNATNRKARFDVQLLAGDAIETDAIDVPPRRQEIVALPIEPSVRGDLDVRVQATGAAHHDASTRTIEVHTPGLAVAHAETIRLDAGTAAIEVEIPPGDASNELELRLHSRSVTTALLDLDELSTAVTDDPRALAVDLAVSASLLAWGRGHAMREDRQARLRGRALAAVGLLRLLQRADGAFGMRRGGEASPYMTTAVLEGLLEAEAAGLPVPPATIDRASSWLAARVADGRLVSLRETQDFTGDPALVRQGVTARTFAVLARVPEAHRSRVVESALRGQTEHWHTAIATASLDALTRAHALSGLVARGQLAAEDVHATARQLLAARTGGHWAPVWFHALDGRRQATAVIATVLHEVAPESFAAHEGEALDWLLRSRERWGAAWHEIPGTASALRALVQLADEPLERTATVEVQMDDRLVQRIAIDPADPLPALQALSRLPLGRDVAPGRHTVHIRVTGELRGTARVVARRWTPGRSGDARLDGRRLHARGPDTAVSGTRVELRIEAGGATVRGGTIRVAKSGLFEVDRAELARRIGPGRAIEAFAIDDEALHLRLAPSRRSVVIAVPLFAARRGEGRLPSVALDPTEGRGTLLVDPGPVRVN